MSDMEFAFVIADEVDAIEIPLLLHEAEHEHPCQRHEYLNKEIRYQSKL
jgi:hypothetical protein